MLTMLSYVDMGICHMCITTGWVAWSVAGGAGVDSLLDYRLLPIVVHMGSWQQAGHLFESHGQGIHVHMHAWTMEMAQAMHCPHVIFTAALPLEWVWGSGFVWTLQRAKLPM